MRSVVCYSDNLTR